MPRVTNLKDLFVHELRDLYSAENKILQSLPKLEESASTPELKDAFRVHRDQTERQIERLDQILSRMDVSPRGVPCKGIEGILEEGQDVLKSAADPSVLDASLIGAAQKVEHYEISGYGTACTYARLLGENNALDLLSQTLEEEKDTDRKLTAIAMERVNIQALKR